MLLSKGVIFSKEDCFALVESNDGFTEAKLYYKADGGISTPIVIPTQRKAYDKDFFLLKNTILYNKIDCAIKHVGYKLKSENIRCNIVKYRKGDFIRKHSHNRDAGVFITVVIQLNEHYDYKGGDFVYWINGVEYKLDTEIGSGIVIGPEVEHEVTMITEGERNSFVLFLDYKDVSLIQKKSIL